MLIEIESDSMERIKLRAVLTGEFDVSAFESLGRHKVASTRLTDGHWLLGHQIEGAPVDNGGLLAP